MKISYDQAKHLRNLKERNLDFDLARDVFAGLIFEYPDERFEYGEERIITVGYLNGRMVIVVWTWRGSVRHIISMRKTNEKEQKRFKNKLG